MVMLCSMDYSDRAVYALAGQLASLNLTPMTSYPFSGPQSNAHFATPLALASYTNSYSHCPNGWSNIVGNGREEFDIEDKRNWPELFQKPKRKPHSNYICHNCYAKADHYVKHCPKLWPDYVKCTPYQGSKQCIGEFYCRKCKRHWLSHRSSSNTSERCKLCKNDYFPKKQYTEETALKCGLYEKPRYRKYRAKFSQTLDSFSSSGRGTNSPVESDSGRSSDCYQPWSTNDQ